MDSPACSADRGRLARIALTAALALLALRSFLRGNRVRGALVGIGAVAIGYTTVESTDLTLVEVDTPDEESELRCAVCGEPIVPGERRVPNEAGETAHEACLDAT